MRAPYSGLSCPSGVFHRSERSEAPRAARLDRLPFALAAASYACGRAEWTGVGGHEP